MDIRVHLLISGRVQGVFYRASTRDKAEQLGVKGWVRNTIDGGVEAVFEGEKLIVNELVRWCHNGPRLADVSDVKVDYKKFLNEFKDFSIKY